MKLGLYSITYRGVWYKGPALDLFELLRLAKRQGWEGVELDTERPHRAPIVAQMARETKRVTQMGNQGMAFEGNRLLKEWVWGGVIGAVREVHVWSDLLHYKYRQG